MLQVVQKGKDEIQDMYEEENAKIQKEKDELLTEKTGVKEEVTKALRSVLGSAQEEHEALEVQVMKLAKAIHQLDARIMDLEIQAVPNTPKEVRDQREEADKSAVGRIKILTLECNKLSDRSANTYECLTEDPKLRKLEAQIQEAQQQASTVKVQIKLLTMIERMKIPLEKHAVQQ
jgi:hypothetical protein